MNNVTIERHKATQVSIQDLNTANYVIVMEKKNKEDLLKLFPSLDENKIYLLLEDTDIEDPWYTNNFMKVYELINKGCKLWFNKLLRSDSNEV